MRSWTVVGAMRVGFCFMLVAGLAGITAVSGCDQQAKVTKTEEVSTPDGRTKVTDEKTIEKSGDHKDTAPAVNAP